MSRTTQELLASGRMQQLLAEADIARRFARVSRPAPRLDQRIRNSLGLRLQFAH